MDKKNNSRNSNSGYRNSGYRNSGDMNSGDINSGNSNSGYRNSGNWNSGDCNSGDMNSGHRNSGNWNSGAFNTDCPKMRIFNKEINMTVEEFYNKYNLCANIPLNRWIEKDKMTAEEKNTIKGWNEMGGYLKTLGYKEACRVWWQENPDEHERFLNLPNFDAEIFEEITGIDVNLQDEIDVTAEGKTTRISRKSALALGLLGDK